MSCPRARLGITSPEVVTMVSHESNASFSGSKRANREARFSALEVSSLKILTLSISCSVNCNVSTYYPSPSWTELKCGTIGITDLYVVGPVEINCTYSISARIRTTSGKARLGMSKK